MIGVAFSTPIMTTFRSTVEQTVFFSQELLTINSSDNALGFLYERARLLGKLVESRAGEIAEHLTTTMVARDMQLLVNALGDEGLQYWGFSYVIEY